MKDKNSFRIDFNVSRETMNKVEHYHALLQEWGHTHNLIQRRDLENFWERHAADSAQLINYIPTSQPPIFDLGSGAGLPGLILSILTPCSIFLFEANQKKVVFLEHVIHTLNLTAKVIPGRIEDTFKNFYEKQTYTEVIVTSRALGSLSYILSLKTIVSRETHITYLLHKSQNQLEKEIDLAKSDWDFQWESFPSLTHQDSAILKITHTKRKH